MKEVGEVEEATVVIGKDEWPDFADAYLAQGLFEEKGEVEEAIRSYRKAIEVKPDFAEVFEFRDCVEGRWRGRGSDQKLSESDRSEARFCRCVFELGNVLKEGEVVQRRNLSEGD